MLHFKQKDTSYPSGFVSVDSITWFANFNCTFVWDVSSEVQPGIMSEQDDIGQFYLSEFLKTSDSLKTSSYDPP